MKIQLTKEYTLDGKRLNTLSIREEAKADIVFAGLCAPDTEIVNILLQLFANLTDTTYDFIKALDSRDLVALNLAYQKQHQKKEGLMSNSNTTHKVTHIKSLKAKLEPSTQIECRTLRIKEGCPIYVEHADGSVYCVDTESIYKKAGADWRTLAPKEPVETPFPWFIAAVSTALTAIIGATTSHYNLIDRVMAWL